jgi:hypothetical protein
MRHALALVVVFAVSAHGADDTPQASGTLDGKRVVFPTKGIADGVKATVGLLESCCSESLYQADELQKATRGDHVRLVFATPVAVTVMGKKLAASEVVFRLPMNTGVFWVRTGNTWRRFSKYQPQKEKPFRAWLREAQLVKDA